jgi:NADPH:quinone reductase-like Zn-dependent oxidoreductase
LTGIAGNVPTIQMMVKQIRLQGIIVGSRRHQIEMIRAFDGNPATRPVIDRSFPLANLGDAFRHEEGATHFGKICVEM